MSEDDKLFKDLVAGREARDMGNNELVEALSYIPDITEALGNLEEEFDGALFLGMLEELIDLYSKKI